MKSLQDKINRLKNEQSVIKKQMAVFQEAMHQMKNQELGAEVIQANKFTKKKCEHDAEISLPFNIPAPATITHSSRNQITIQTGQ
jgi:hypothetical protein